MQMLCTGKVEQVVSPPKGSTDLLMLNQLKTERGSETIRKEVIASKRLEGGRPNEGLSIGFPAWLLPTERTEHKQDSTGNTENPNCVSSLTILASAPLSGTLSPRTSAPFPASLGKRE